MTPDDICVDVRFQSGLNIGAVSKSSVSLLQLKSRRAGSQAGKTARLYTHES